MSFDLNIQNYGPKDIVALFKLPPTYCDADVDEKAESIRAQLFTENMATSLKEDISQFLDAARDMIKRDWVQQLPGREDLVSRPALPYVPAKVEEFTKGDMNPYAKRTMTKMASIDTLFRINSSTTPSTDFSYVLPESVRNVVSMRLASIEIPNVAINTFSTLNKNNVFYVKLYNITAKADKQITITIPDGNYTSISMKDTINQLLIEQEAHFVFFDILATHQCVFRARDVTDGGEWPYNTAQSYYSPNFRFELFFGVETKLLCASAGWYLGFRNVEYDAPITITYTVRLSDMTTIKYYNYVVSESPWGSSEDSYLFLEVDDFHNNFQTDTVISTNATSYVGKNILARVVLNAGSLRLVQNNGNDGMFKKREYLGPVRIERLHFRLLNKFGEVVDLTNSNFSFALEFVTIYS
jgi:hypothetical protein